MININSNVIGGIRNIFISLINNYKNNVINDGGTIESLRCANNEAIRLRRNLLSNFTRYSRNVYNTYGNIEPSVSSQFDNFSNSVINTFGTPIYFFIANGYSDKLFGLTPENLTISYNGIETNHKVRTNRSGRIERIRKNLINNSTELTVVGSFSAITTTISGITAQILYPVSLQNGVDYSLGLRDNGTISFVSGMTYTVSFRVKLIDSYDTFSYYITAAGYEIGATFNVRRKTSSSNYSTNTTKIERRIIDEGNDTYLVSETFRTDFNFNSTYSFFYGFGNGLNAQTIDRMAIFFTPQIEEGTHPSDYQITASNGTNTPRINFSGSTPAWLFEPARTNLILHSNNLFSGWTFHTAFITATTSSLFTNRSDNSYIMNVTGGSGLRRFLPSTIPSGRTITASVFIKNINTTSFRLNQSNGFDSEFTTQWVFTGSSPQFQSIINPGTFTNITPSVESNYNDGWFRINITSTLGSGTSQFSVSNLIIINTGGGLLQVSQYDVVDSPFPTTPIITTNSSVTRLTESATLSNIILGNSGTIYLNSRFLQRGTIFRLITPNNQNSIGMFNVDNTGRVEYFIQTSGVTNSFSDITSLNNRNNKKHCIIYTPSVMKVFIDGQLLIQVPRTFQSFTQNNFTLQMGSLSETANGDIKSFIIFDRALSDAEAINLTTL